MLCNLLPPLTQGSTLPRKRKRQASEPDAPPGGAEVVEVEGNAGMYASSDSDEEG